jgi:hypothetical protein
MFKLPLKFFFFREVEIVFFGKYEIFSFWEGVFDDDIIFLLAEEYADRLIFTLLSDLSIVVIHIHLHLSDILVCDLTDLEIDEDKTPKKPIIEDEIDIKMI